MSPAMLKTLKNPSLASLFSQHYAAARTRIHLDAGGRLPFVPAEPVICPCGTMGPATVISARFGESGAMVLIPPCGHELHLDLNRGPGIVAARFQDPSVKDGEMRHRIATHSYTLVEKIVRISFAGPPPGYLDPQRMLLEGLYAILARRVDASGLTSRLCHLFERMAEEDPICLWIDQHVAEAAMHSAVPQESLNETRWYHRRCVFFLPPGTLAGPQGANCRVLAYIVIPAGLYDLLDMPKRFVVYEPRLFLWILDPTTHTSYQLDIRLSAWREQIPFPGDEGEAAFYRRALDLVLIFNALGLSPQAQIDETQIQSRNATKKERRKGLELQRKRFNCPFLRFARKKPTSHGQSSGRKLRPHNKPGWFQRYHTSKGTVWHYRPPHRANAHLERDHAQPLNIAKHT